jgi:hypothetical protein
MCDTVMTTDYNNINFDCHAEDVPNVEASCADFTTDFEPSNH